MVFLKGLLALVIGYALGNFQTGIIVSRLGSGMDIRSSGSGGTGATNMLRTLGWVPSLLTFLGDVVKGLLGVLIGKAIGGAEYAAVLGVVGGLGAIIGHNWPAAFGFKGGKGISTSFGAILMLQPLYAAIILAAFIVCTALTHTVSIGSLVGSTVYLILNLITSTGGRNTPVLVFAILVEAMALYSHRENIKRIFANKENAIDFKRIQRWKRK